MGRRRLAPFEAEITALGPKGQGRTVAPDGRPAVVRFGVPGGRVLVRPTGRKRGVWRGVRTALIRPPPNYVEPPCPLFGRCGGCALQELPLARQRELKMARAKEDVGDAPWDPTVRGTASAYAYRNKIELSFGTSQYLDETSHRAGVPIDGRFLGFHTPGRFDRVVDVERCALVDETMNQTLAAMRAQVLVPGAPPPYDPRTHEGFFRHLLLRRGEGGVLVGLFTVSPSASERGFVERIASRMLDLPDVSGFVWFRNDGVADVAQGEVEQIWGEPTLQIALGTTRFTLDPRAFFQTNTAAAAVLYATIGEALGSGHRLLLDLYCGAGSIGIFLADRSRELLGVESVPEAVENARRNAAANGVRARFLAARVEQVLDRLSGGPGVAAVVDPPRAGLHPKVADALASASLEVLVYVACNPASLGRDRRRLEAGGWVLERCWAVDLFPQTGHLEVVARFVRSR